MKWATPVGEASSGGGGEEKSEKLERILKELINKVAQVIIQSRVDFELIPPNHHHRLSQSKAHQQRIQNKWFGLLVDDVESIYDSLTYWRANPLEPFFLDIYLSHPTQPSVLLERWLLRHENQPMSNNSSGGPNAGTEGIGVGQEASSVYKRSVVLIRYLFTYLKILPVYNKLVKIIAHYNNNRYSYQNKSSSNASNQAQTQSNNSGLKVGHNPSSGGGNNNNSLKTTTEYFLSHQVSSSPSPLDPSERANFVEYPFPPVYTQSGALFLSVLYRRESNFQLLKTRSGLVVSRGDIINDYVSPPSSIEKSAPIGILQPSSSSSSSSSSSFLGRTKGNLTSPPDSFINTPGSEDFRNSSAPFIPSTTPSSGLPAGTPTTSMPINTPSSSDPSRQFPTMSSSLSSSYTTPIAFPKPSSYQRSTPLSTPTTTNPVSLFSTTPSNPVSVLSATPTNPVSILSSTPSSYTDRGIGIGGGGGGLGGYQRVKPSLQLSESPSPHSSSFSERMNFGFANLSDQTNNQQQQQLLSRQQQQRENPLYHPEPFLLEEDTSEEKELLVFLDLCKADTSLEQVSLAEPQNLVEMKASMSIFKQTFEDYRLKKKSF